MTGPKILSIDIETTPNLAHVWGLWDQNVGLPQLLEATEVMCWAAKWKGTKGTEFRSGFHDGKEQMIERVHALLDEADVVMHFNGKRFDIPHLNREFLEIGLTPPSPFKQIDLLSVVKKNFKFPSYKLAYVSKALGLEGKVEHEGHTLWIACMAGDPAAWRRMKKYNIRDVTLLEDVHDRLLPWISSYPNVNLYADESDDGSVKCTKCGSDKVVKEGKAYTDLSVFQQWSCKSCGSWFRSTRRDRGATERSVAS